MPAFMPDAAVARQAAQRFTALRCRWLDFTVDLPYLVRSLAWERTRLRPSGSNEVRLAQCESIAQLRACSEGTPGHSKTTQRRDREYDAIAWYEVSWRGGGTRV